MNRHALYDCGLDRDGNRHWRLKACGAIRCHRHLVALFPRVVLVSRPGTGRVVWRNGLQQRRWEDMAALARSHRRSFRATLPRPALLPSAPPSFQ